MGYFDGYQSATIHLDVKCGEGWEGVKGECKRATPKEPRSNPLTVKNALKALVIAAQISYGIKATKFLYAKGKAINALQGVQPFPPEDLSVISRNEADKLKSKQDLGTGMYGTATLSKDEEAGKEYVVKRQSRTHQKQDDVFSNIHNAVYTYSSSMEATVADIGRGSGVPMPQTSMFPYAPAMGPIPQQLGGTVQEVASGETIDKILTGKEGKRLTNFKEYDRDKFPLPISPDAEVIIGAYSKTQRAAFKGVTRSNLEAMKHPDLAKIMAFDSFVGNGDRHGSNLFYDKNTGGFTAIDNAGTFLTQGYTRSIARSLKDTTKYQEILQQDPSLKAGLIEYKKTLEDLIAKNPPAKTKSRLLGYMKAESDPKGVVALFEFFSRADKILQVDSNYKESQRIVGYLDKILG